MKKYTFSLNNTPKTTFRNTTTTDASKALDNIIFANIKKANPWLGGNFSLEPPLDTLSLDELLIHTPKKSKSTTIDIEISTKPKKSISDFNLFIEAINYFANKKNTGDIFDYRLADGTPIKFFDDEIQIGLDLIPLTGRISHNLFNSLNYNTKKTIIDIYIKIKG